jgi:hypothetical protein
VWPLQKEASPELAELLHAKVEQTFAPTLLLALQYPVKQSIAAEQE